MSIFGNCIFCKNDAEIVMQYVDVDNPLKGYPICIACTKEIEKIVLSYTTTQDYGSFHPMFDAFCEYNRKMNGADNEWR
jgi:hypothetical protein